MPQTLIPDAVKWYDGMRLAPQHFEQQEARMQRLGAYLHMRTQPFDWGLLKLTLSIVGTSVTLDELEAIMPDGQCVAVVKGLHTAPTRDILALASTGTMLWLHVHGCDTAHAEFERPGGRPVFQVQTLRPYFSLVTEAPPGVAEDALLPLARLEPEGPGLKLASDYIAPWLRVEFGSVVYRHFARLSALLRTCYEKMADECRSAQSMGRNADMAHKQSVMSSLCSHILEISAHDMGQLIHPYQAYQQLCRLRGALAAVDLASSCPSVPRFDYRKLDACLTPLFHDIGECCARLAPKYRAEKFAFVEPEGFTIALACFPNAEQYYIGLKRPARASEADMLAWLENATLGDARHYNELTSLRISGIAAVPLAQAEARTILPQPDLTLFRLEGTGSARTGFDPNITLRIDGAEIEGQVVPLEILLIGKTPEKVA